jgi:hypothetical protein
MKTRRFSLLVLGLILVAGLPCAAAERGAEREAERAFTNADVRGPYGFFLEGTINTVGPVAAIGFFAADGNGTLADGTRTINVNGAVFRQTFRCTYTVNPNGTGSAECTILSGGSGKETFDVVLTDKSRKIPFVATDPGRVIRGAAIEQ